MAETINAAAGHVEKLRLVKHPHLEGSYLVIWDRLFYLKLLSAERLRVGLLLTDASILGHCFFTAVLNLILILWRTLLLLALHNTNNQANFEQKYFFIVTCTRHGH